MADNTRTLAGPRATGFTRGLVSELDMVSDWGLLTTAADLTITGWNRWLERRAGRPANEILGRPLFDVFPSLVTRKFDAYYRKALHGQTMILSQRLHKYLLPLQSPSAGPRFEFMQQTARVVPLVQGGSVCGTVTLVEDVTERVAYEAELRERVDELREADRRKDEFLAMLAHELRNPLAPIANAVQILSKAELSDPTLYGVHEMIGRQVTQLSRLVDDLLDVSRITRGKVQLQRIPLNLAAVVRHAIEACRPLLDARRHRLTLSLPSEPVCIDGDLVRLAQVVGNLLNNAAKYTDEGGEVWLTVEARTDGSSALHEAVVKVRDNGRGIDSTALSSLFDMFYQVDRTLDRSDGGLGIGLALVKNLAEMHGGSVEAYSAGRGKGSEFTLRLPLKKEGLATELMSIAPPMPAAPLTRILVVDDNRDSADSMAMLLQLDGHEVWTAYDGNEAVEIALQERPEVILLDIGLPGLNGYQACKAMREGGSDALVIAMTGYGQEEDRLLSQQAGFDTHQIKPLEVKELRRLLANRKSNH